MTTAPVLCSSCRAPIVWTHTTSGERMPVDPEPVAGGNIRLTTAHGTLLASVVGSTIDLFDQSDDGIRYQSHFASCPDAADWRANQAAAGGAA